MITLVSARSGGVQLRELLGLREDGCSRGHHWEGQDGSWGQTAAAFGKAGPSSSTGSRSLTQRKVCGGPAGPWVLRRCSGQSLSRFWNSCQRAGGAAFLESEDAGPVLARTNTKDSAAGREAITPNAQAGLGELGFEILRQTVQGLEFASSADSAAR